MIFVGWILELDICPSFFAHHDSDFKKESHLEDCGNFLVFSGCRRCSWSRRFYWSWTLRAFAGFSECFKIKINIARWFVDSWAVSRFAVGISSSSVSFHFGWTLVSWEGGRTIFTFLRWCRTWCKQHSSRKPTIAFVNSERTQIGPRRVLVASRLAPGSERLPQHNWQQ